MARLTVSLPAGRPSALLSSRAFALAADAVGGHGAIVVGVAQRLDAISAAGPPPQ
jgi:hypothetical protein